MRTLRLIVAAVGLTALAAGVNGHPAAAADVHTLIEGSGSSWANNAMSQWSADVQRNGMMVVYSADGSAAGKQDFANRLTDFAVTDLPYFGPDSISGVNDTSQGRAYGDIPIAAGGTAFPYHLTIGGKQIRSLRLSGVTLAKIFTNQISNWDDPEITAENNGARLPSLKITPVVPSQGSGTAYELTTYLADRYPNLWKTYSGSSQPTETFPRAGHQVAENGSLAVMNSVRAAGANGAIGVTEYSYALSANYPVAAIENVAGYYLIPSQYNVAIALRSATIDEDPVDDNYMRPDLRPVFASTDRRAYPLSSYTSMLIPTGNDAAEASMTTAKRQTLADFAYSDICQGQAEVSPIGYAPLPLNLVQAGFTQIARLGAADPAVDLTDRNVSTCDNPTFLKTFPTRDHLGSIAPEPPACSKRGQGPCAVQTVARLTASRVAVRTGQTVVFHGQLVDRPETGGPPHAPVDLQRRLPHHWWTTIAARRTSVAGAVTVRLAVQATTRYRLVDVEPGSGRLTSSSVQVAVS